MALYNKEDPIGIMWGQWWKNMEPFMYFIVDYLFDDISM